MNQPTEETPIAEPQENVIYYDDMSKEQLLEVIQEMEDKLTHPQTTTNYIELDLLGVGVIKMNSGDCSTKELLGAALTFFNQAKLKEWRVAGTNTQGTMV